MRAEVDGYFIADWKSADINADQRRRSSRLVHGHHFRVRISTMDIESVLAGLVAYLISVLGAVLLVFLTYRINNLLTSKEDEEQLLRSGNKSVAISLGSVVLSQSILLRHAVFPTMAVLRDLFLRPANFRAAIWVIAHCALFFLIIGVLSFGSVWFAGWLFTRMTRSLPEQEEIMKDNIAVGIFYALVVIGITLILNEGIEDLSRSIIPYHKSGVIQIE
jgi:uncharacterized membrane protein YjfL (UPF0719 family)